MRLSLQPVIGSCSQEASVGGARSLRGVRHPRLFSACSAASRDEAMASFVDAADAGGVPSAAAIRPATRGAAKDVPLHTAKPPHR